MYCIFQMHDSTEDFGAWSDVQWSSSDSEYSRYRLQPPEFQSRQLRRLLKVFGSVIGLIPLTPLIRSVLLLQVHSEETEQSMRPCVAKSYSFGGYGGGVSILTRGDSVISTHSAPGSRPLTKQGFSVKLFHNLRLAKLLMVSFRFRSQFSVMAAQSLEFWLQISVANVRIGHAQSNIHSSPSWR